MGSVNFKLLQKLNYLPRSHHQTYPIKEWIILLFRESKQQLSLSFVVEFLLFHLQRFVGFILCVSHVQRLSLCLVHFTLQQWAINQGLTMVRISAVEIKSRYRKYVRTNNESHHALEISIWFLSFLPVEPDQILTLTLSAFPKVQPK